MFLNGLDGRHFSLDGLGRVGDLEGWLVARFGEVALPIFEIGSSNGSKGRSGIPLLAPAGDHIGREDDVRALLRAGEVGDDCRASIVSSCGSSERRCERRSGIPLLAPAGDHEGREGDVRALLLTGEVGAGCRRSSSCSMSLNFSFHAAGIGRRSS